MLALFSRATWPGRYAPVLPDSLDYTYGAAALLHGQYQVAWDGPPHTPRYTPGMALLLTPAIAVGGVGAAPLVPYVLAIALGALAALVAARVAGSLAGPVAAATVLYAKAPVEFGGVVMSDLPAAALGMLELALLVVGRSAASAFGAGLLAGALAWVRPVSVLLLAAGLAAVTARPGWRRRALGYVAGALLPLAALAIWQWLLFGSPLETTYQAAGSGVGGGRTLGAFFSLAYATGAPAGGDNAGLGGPAMDWSLPNLAVYPLQLVGADAFLCLPGVGVIGLIGLLRLAPRTGAAGVAGRFGIAVVLITLGVYVPYHWQSGRFLVFASSLLGVGAAALLVQLIDQLAATRLRGADTTRRGAAG